MNKTFCYLLASLFSLFFTLSSFGLIIPTQSEKVDLYLGLFGSIDNPALHTGCYTRPTSMLTAKELIEDQYTEMDCVDTVNKMATPGMVTSFETSSASDDMMRNMLIKASAFQFGLNFSFNS